MNFLLWLDVIKIKKGAKLRPSRFCAHRASESAKTIYESGARYATKFVQLFRRYTRNKKKRVTPLSFSLGISFPFLLVSLFVAVAASAVLAVTCAANVNAIKLAMHTVLIVLAVRNAAGNTVVNIFRHRYSSLRLLCPIPQKVFQRVDKRDAFR